MIKKYLFRPFLIMASALLVSGISLAQDNSTDADDEYEGMLEEVIVTGVKYSMVQAVEIKRNSMEIVDSIVSEDLGKFPDNNVVEAMQRIPGVQVTDRGAGEVSSVSIRGLSDVTTTINGRNIFTAAGRAVALQDIPATLVNRVDVYKTRSADQIARGIAGQIDVHTNRPFDFEEGFKFLGQARGTYMEESDEFDPQLSMLLSNTWETGNGKFGASLNVAWTKTNWRDQAANAGASFPFRPLDDPTNPLGQIPTSEGWTPGLDQGLPTAPGSTLDLNPDQEFLHWRDAMFNFDFQGERKRPAGNLALQWAPNDRSEYTMEVFYNGYREDIFNSLWFQFLNSPIYDVNDPVGMISGTNIIRSRTMGDGFSFTSGDVTWQKTDSWVYALRGAWDLTDNLFLESEIVYQDSKFETDFWGQRVARIAPEFFIDINGGDGVPNLNYDPSGSGAPGTDATNRDNYWLDWAFVNGGRDDGDAFTWTGDADYDVEWGWFNTISFGARYDDRNATQKNAPAPSGGPVDGTTLADMPDDFTTFNTDEFFDGHPGVLQSWLVADPDYVQSNQDQLMSIYGFAPRTYNTVFEIGEKQVAAYLQADFSHELSNGGFIDGRAGLRYLDVKTDISAPDADGNFVDATNKNSTWLPSLMLRWGITENLLARASYTETFNLPSFADLNPYINYVPDVTDIGYGTATGGNADLEPIESKNIDISLEWYFAEGSVLYATYFNRDISNNIVPFRNAVVYDVPDDVPDRGEYTYILSQPDNAGNATLDGWEFGFTYFPELPGWLNGFGLQASYTSLDSEQELPIVDSTGNITGYDISPIGGVSDSSYNVILAYDRDNFNARLSYFWRDDFYNNNEAALFANPLQVWRGAEESLDFQLTWLISDRWTATFDATNLTQPTFNWNYGNEPDLFNFHNYFYSRTFSVGIRFQL